MCGWTVGHAPAPAPAQGKSGALSGSVSQVSLAFKLIKKKRIGGSDLCGVVKAVGHGWDVARGLSLWALQYQAETRPEVETSFDLSVFSGPRH
jgi:hypothetical protein